MEEATRIDGNPVRYLFAGFKNVPFGEYYHAEDYQRIISMITPPPDAAVREAVEGLERKLAWLRSHPKEESANVGIVQLRIDLDILLSYVRAVQAPRLTGDDGVSLIAAERARQVAVEGWTPEHDAQHVKGELSNAAAYYCAEGPQEWLEAVVFPISWICGQWAKRQGFPMPTTRDLVKAGALIAAELDRRRAAFPELAGEVGRG